MEAPPDQSSWLIQFGIAAAGAIGLILANIFKGYRAPELPTRHTIEAAEITDTRALSEKIIADLTPKLEKLLGAGLERDRKIDEVLDRLRKQETRDEISKLAREEVARQLEAEHRDRDRPRA